MPSLLSKVLLKKPRSVVFGTVKKVLEFGAFVEFFREWFGAHFEKPTIAWRRSKTFFEGDEVYVKCIGVERNGKIRLSRKEALAENEE